MKSSTRTSSSPTQKDADGFAAPTVDDASASHEQPKPMSTSSDDGSQTGSFDTEAVSQVPARRTNQELAAAARASRWAPPSTVAGATPKDAAEARELLTRAVVEMALQPESLRKLRDLMRQGDNKQALATWVELLKLVQSPAKDESNNGRPVQIQLNNYIARPGKGTPKTVEAKVVT